MNTPVYKFYDCIDEDKLNMLYLLANPYSIHTIKLFDAKPDRIDFDWLSKNPNAINLLKKHFDKLSLKANPSIFALNYKQMTINFKPLAEEIIARAYDPDRIKRLSIIYKFEFKDWFNF